MADAHEDARKHCDAAIEQVTAAGVRAAQGEGDAAAAAMLRALGHLQALREALVTPAPTPPPPQRMRQFTREEIQDRVRRRLGWPPYDEPERVTVARRRAEAKAAEVRAREERAQRKAANAALREQVAKLKAANKSGAKPPSK